MCRPPATTDRRQQTTTPAEADSNLATGPLNPPCPEALRPMAKAATTEPGAAPRQPSPTIADDITTKGA